MKKIILILAAACAFLCAPLVSAMPLSYDIEVDGTFTGIPPFGLSNPPGKLTAKIKVDEAKPAGKDQVIDFVFVTGTKTWDETLLGDTPLPTALTFKAGVLTAFHLSFTDLPAGLFLASNKDDAADNTFNVTDGGRLGLFCADGCVSFAAAASNAPAPGTLALLLGAVAGAGGFARRRKSPG